MDVRDPHHAERLSFTDPDEYLRRRDFLGRTAMAAGLAAGMGLVLDPETLVAQAASRQRRVPLPSPRNMPIDTFVVIMMENRSFDHYLGWMEKADGRQAGVSYVDRDGNTQTTAVLTPDFQGCDHPDPDHGWNDGRIHLNGGRMDGFLKSPDNDSFAIGYYPEGDVPFIGPAGKAFTTFDRFFCSVLASTFPNREYMHAADSYGEKGNEIPGPQHGFDSGRETGFPDNTIFAALAARGIDARYFYSDIPASALWGEEGLSRSGPVSEYYTRAATGTLPALSFVDPSFANASGGTSGDEHPHGDIRVGQAFMSDVVHAFMASPQYSRGALFIVYDEWGGFFDHVRPPRVPDQRNSRDIDEDFGQMGIRIPAVAVSPWVRNGHVDHGIYGFESILKMISYRYGLAPLNRRVAYARNIAHAFDFRSRPRLIPPEVPDPASVALHNCPEHTPGLFYAPSTADEERAAAEAPEPPPEDAPEPERPKSHDLYALETSGYLDSLGFDYQPATPERIFRRPYHLRAALLESRRRQLALRRWRIRRARILRARWRAHARRGT